MMSLLKQMRDNTFSSTLTVEPRMDISHMGDLVVEVEDDSLQGPWTISGMLLRTGGSEYN